MITDCVNSCTCLLSQRLLLLLLLLLTLLFIIYTSHSTLHTLHFTPGSNYQPCNSQRGFVIFVWGFTHSPFHWITIKFWQITITESMSESVRYFYSNIRKFPILTYYWKHEWKFTERNVSWILKMRSSLFCERQH